MLALSVFWPVGFLLKDLYNSKCLSNTDSFLDGEREVWLDEVQNANVLECLKTSSHVKEITRYLRCVLQRPPPPWPQPRQELLNDETDVVMFRFYAVTRKSCTNTDSLLC